MKTVCEPATSNLQPATSFRARVFSTLSILISFLFVLCACQGVFQPFRLKDAEAAPSAEANSPVLLRIATCWPAVPLVEDLVAALHSDGGRSSSGSNLSYDIIPADSSAALDLLVSGQADLAILGRQPGAEELAVQTSGGEQHTLDSRLLALDVIGIAVHQDSPLRGLTTRELGQLFSGHYLDWQELRAGQGPPELVSLADGSDAQEVFERIVLGGHSVSSTAIVMPHDRGVLEYVAQHPGAVGYASIAFGDEHVRWVAIDGALPIATQVQAGKYPLTHPLVLITMPDASPEALRLASFATSAQGRQIIGHRYVLPR